jgi:hypothetical protein
MEQMKTLLVSGNTLQEWNIDEILTSKVNQSNKDIIEKIELQEIYENRQEWYFNHRMSLMERIK